MYLKSISLKGFKSFPSRTRLDFAPGVSVIVGPNGSGKSNIADGIVWALGEQSAGAIRGQNMQDFLFGGAPGIPSASSAEVELVFDNDDGTLGSDFKELSIMRRLDRNGDGEYRINGARCRLIDVIEVLADTGLGKEMHSVLSQGKVDHVVGSKPRDRRLLIEEAAGLGKHRKRRRRAQLKLARTRDNLDRVLDVEREARSRLKPLKRQAEAAETHERLERQANELRALLAADRLLAVEAELAAAREAASTAREARAAIEQQLAQVATDREQAEREIAAQAAQREQIANQLFAVRTACERIERRRERAGERVLGLEAEIQRCNGELQQLELDVTPEIDDARLRQLEQELQAIEQRLRSELDEELAELVRRCEAARVDQHAAESRHAAAVEAVADAERTVGELRAAARERRTAHDDARRRRASLDGELAAIERYIGESSAQRPQDALAESIEVEPGFEQAVAAVLGYRLNASVVSDIRQANRLLDGRGEEGGTALVTRSGGSSRAAVAPPGGELLGSHLSVDGAAAPVVEALLRDVWVVDGLDELNADFSGIAVTRSGRVFFGPTGEVRQTPGGGEQRELTARNRRSQIKSALDEARAAESGAEAALAQSHEQIERAEGQLEQSLEAAAQMRRARDEARGAADALAATIDKRREAGAAEGPLAVKRAAIEAEVRSERAMSDRVRQAVELQRRRREQLTQQLAQAEIGLPAARELAAVLGSAAEAARERVERFTRVAEQGRGGAQAVTERLRELAAREASLQASLHGAGDQVTTAEVRSQRAKDVSAELAVELEQLAVALGAPVEPAAAPLAEPDREEIEAKLARIARRRELLGPINPLAKDEYAEAIAHVEELEGQRDDLEQALKELEDLIREVDRTIKRSFEETFESTSAHFSELLARLFPGGTGELKLVREERPQQPALTGAVEGEGVPESDAADDDLPEDPDAGDERADDYGVEIEVRLPGSKTGRRLTLLSGGERSLVALAFLFSVFLTRPCPFYVFDEAEAALDDINIDRLVSLLREHSEQSQFIVITHQKRTMDAADQLYGVSMGADGITKVVSRRLTREDESQQPLEPAAA